MAYHTHHDGGPVCGHATKKACDEAYAEWSAMQQVLLAYRIVTRGHTKAFKGDRTVFGQLVAVVAGEQDVIMVTTGKEKGNPSRSPEVKHLRAAIQCVIEGNLPRYNLYQIPTPPATGS